MSDTLSTLSVRQLRAYIAARGGTTAGAVEKGDLVAAARSVATRPDLTSKTCRTCGAPARRVCAGCSLLAYCSAACAAADAIHPAIECGLTRAVRPRAACGDGDLGRALPWAVPLMADAHPEGDCGQPLARVLTAAGVAPDGYWRREVGRGQGVPFGELPPPASAGAAWGGMDQAGVPPPDTPLAAAPDPPLASWAAYLAARGLPSTSLAPLLLHPALTVYAAVAEVLAARRRTDASSASGAPVVVHLLGAEGELDALPLFAEVSHLLPTTRLELVVIGPAVPATRHGEVLRLTPHATVTLVRGLYHEYVAGAAGAGRAPAWVRPAVVVALNAGLCAYAEWFPTLAAVTDRGLLLVATDYIEYSVALPRVRYGIVLGGRGEWGAPTLNPFRQPKTRCTHGSDLFPIYSDGFRVVLDGRK